MLLSFFSSEKQILTKLEKVDMFSIVLKKQFIEGLEQYLL